MSDSQRQVLLFGSYDARLHPRVAVLREGLSAADDVQVTEVNEPLGLSTADKIAAASSVGGAVRLCWAIARSWVSLWRRSRRLGIEPDLVVVGYLGHFDVHLARRLWPRTPLALDHLVGLADTTRDRGVAPGLRGRVLEYIDRSALRRADLVIVDTQEQLEQLDSTTQEKAVIVPVGATGEWFDAPAPPPAPPLRVCFIGVFTPLHGAPVIGAAVAALADDPGFHFTMVGTGQDHEATRSVASANPHVEWLDWVDGRDLPALVASHHVTLGIFGTTPKALRVVPTKVYQGLAAGNEVITSDTAPQRRALGDAAHYVAPGDAEALVVALREVAADSAAGGPQVVAERRARRERFRAAEVVAPLLDAEWRREPG